MQNLQDKTIKELAKDCRSVDDVHEMLKDLFKDTLQQIFEAVGVRVSKIKRKFIALVLLRDSR